MNILIIAPNTSGTIAGLSYNLYRAFLVSGQNAFLLCLDGSQQEVPSDINAIIFEAKKGIGGKLRNSIRKINVIRNVIKKYSINVSVSTLLGCTLWNILSKTRVDCKVGIFHTRPYQSIYLGRIKHIVFSIIYRYVIPKLNVVVAVNQTAKEAIEDTYNVKAHLIYNIHDFERINELANQQIFEDLIFLRPTFLYVGHLTKVKAPERLVKAFAQINTSKQYSLCFIGTGSLELELKELVRAYELEDSVFFLGFQNNPYKYIARSKCLILPSQDEGLPGVLIEALFLGKRVITTNSSKGVWEILQCLEDYDSKLSYRYCNGLGTIVPNYFDTPEQDNITVKELAQAMLDEVQGNVNNQTLGFDYSRFSAPHVVSKYMDLL